MPTTVGPSQPVARVLIVDIDHRVRRDLTELIDLRPDLVVVGSAGDSGSVTRMATTVAPDVVVIDPRLPDADTGLAVVARLRRDQPRVHIVVMSHVAAMEAAALAAGADHFVLKSGHPAVLLEALAPRAGGDAPA